MKYNKLKECLKYKRKRITLVFGLIIEIKLINNNYLGWLKRDTYFFKKYVYLNPTPKTGVFDTIFLPENGKKCLKKAF